MAHKLLFGSFVPGKSFLHKLDPRTKLLTVLFLSIVSFFIVHPLQLILCYLYLFALTRLANYSFLKLLKNSKAILSFIFIIGLINLFFVQGGSTLFSWSIFTITSDGLIAATVFPLRISFIFMLCSLILRVTDMSSLSDALESLISPLARIKLPARELALIFSLMLRFIPLLVEDATQIYEAQVSRGAFLKRGPKARLRAIQAFTFALISCTQRHSEGLATALDARGYLPKQEPTKLYPLHYRSSDALFAACSLIYFALALIFQM